MSGVRSVDARAGDPAADARERAPPCAERGEFELHYQPIIELDTDEVCGFEALVRWIRPDGKITYPAEFIKVAEETRLIIPLTEWVLREACARVSEWQRVLSSVR